MIIGEYEGKLTDKNRLAVPAKIRSEFKSELIVCRGYEGCLLLFDGKRWKDLIKVLSQKPLLQMNIRDTKRFLVGGAHELDLDQQGRFVVPQQLKSYASLNNEVVFVAILDWVEIWDKNNWDRKLAELTESARDIADRLVQEYENKT